MRSFARIYPPWLPGDSPFTAFLLDIPTPRMSFVDDDSLSLAGLDAPDFLQLDDSFSSSLTAHCHPSCATSTCMRASRRRSQKYPRSSPVVTSQEVRTNIHVGSSIAISHPLHRIILHLRPPTAVTSSNLFRLSQKFLHSTPQSSGIYTLICPLPSTITSHPNSKICSVRFLDRHHIW